MWLFYSLFPPVVARARRTVDDDGVRSIWKGAISFGLVTVPVKLYSATEEKDVTFHQVRRADGSRIRYRRVAVADGEEVAFSDIAKGFELPSGETVVLTDEDMAELPLNTSRAIEVHTFVPLAQLDPIYFHRSYYLEPEGTGLKPYILLRDALEQSGRVAIVKVALRQREQLATLRVRNGVFVLETMLWPDEVREAEFEFLNEKVDIRPQELAMAQSLIDSLTADFDPGAYTDSYREALQSLVDAKIAGREVVMPPGAKGESAGADIVDLMAALRASVAAADSARTGTTTRRGRAGAAKPAHVKSAPAKKAAAKATKGAASASTKPAARKAAKAADKTAAKPRSRRSA